MRAPYPKTATEIIVRETRTNLELGISGYEKSVQEIPLSDKINEYVIRLGYSNAHVLGVLVQLMTQGKVRVEFRDYSERLELLTDDEKITRAQAVTLFDDYMSGLSGGTSTGPTMNVTQKIVVQTPRKQV